MAEESFQERTEAPTPKRRKEAQDRGEVPRSQEVTTAFILLAGAGALAGAGGALADDITDVFGFAVMSLTALPVGLDGMVGYVTVLAWKTLGAMAPALLIMTGTALVVSAAQGRGVLTLKPLQPQWSRLDPIKKIPQIWGWRAVVELVKSLVKLGIITLTVYLVLDEAVVDVPVLGQSSPYALLDLLQRYAVKLLLSAGLAYLFLALADYGYQIWQHEKKLKMSREDVKKEHKEMEGDQVVKVRRRTMARQLAHRRMLLSVSEADVVVTNPTHIAVALKYDPDQFFAPVVLAMGERKVAEKIKEIARESNVPTVENKPLARALFATATVGQAIPVDLFVAVAEVLAWVYRQKGMGPRGRTVWKGAEG
ncbi:MAG: EscU/YscU/HrcU family type III secretion system export apparatus switch protein [Gemmatimonadota bacterium]|nr:EscU/YscU/HrcU family type III secretion system export apparatus switch protein [Gemmatimonadota bacterium]MDH5758225.1 EscU/YscU/HrcU family type III secretion system export apparatus switch protein [Gemmatimonadota bacterium]